MKLDELEEKKVKRIGLIPYYFNEDNDLVMLFMIPSDPAFGGSDPQVAKGQCEEHEQEQDTAIREAEEEVGLIKDNIKSIYKAFNGKPFSVFAAEVKDHNNFKQPHFETEKTMWLTAEEFEQHGRDFQKFMVRSIARSIKSKNKGGSHEEKTLAI